ASRRCFHAEARKSNEAHSLMSANSLNSMPITPFPDPPSHSGEEPELVTGQPVDSPAPRNVTKPPISSADDLSLLLAQSDPDPYLAEGVGTSDPADPGKPRADIEGGEPVFLFRLALLVRERARHRLLAFTGYAARIASAFGQLGGTCGQNAGRSGGAPDFLAASARVELRQRLDSGAWLHPLDRTGAVAAGL